MKDARRKRKKIFVGKNVYDKKELLESLRRLILINFIYQKKEFKKIIFFHSTLIGFFRYLPQGLLQFSSGYNLSIRG